MFTMRTLLITAMLVAAVTYAAIAALPQTISYQGFLKDGAGVPVNGATTITFSLYSSSPARNNPVWRESRSVTPTNGIYSTQLGSLTPITAPFDVPYWLGIRVASDPEMALQPLSSTGYAFRAGVANALTAGAAVPGAIPITTTGSTSLSASANTGYLLTNATPGTVTLPGSATVGDVIKLDALGAGGITLALANGQTISGQGIYPDYSVWVPRGAPASWTTLASSADGTKLVAGTNSGQIFTSTDSGTSWTARDAARLWSSAASSADGTKLVAVANSDQIYTSTDSGVNWSPRDATRSWTSVASSADGTKLVAVASNGQIYTSTDSGVTWTPRDAVRNWSCVASSADGTKLVAAVNNGQIYTSSNSGTTWTAQDSVRVWQAVTSSADGVKLVAAEWNGQLYTSTDSGSTWTPRESSRLWSSIASSADGTKLAAGVITGQIYTSVDSGITWTAHANVRNWTSIVSSADGSRLAAAASGENIFMSGTAPLNLPQYGTAELVYAGNGQWLLNSNIGSGSGNTVTDASSSIAGGAGNNVTGTFAAVGGGGGNSSTAYGSSVDGGIANMAGNTAATVSGGMSNLASGPYSSVGGGQNNAASGSASTISGGSNNTASGYGAVIGGGWNNAASNYGSTISGGSNNTASGYDAVVGGGTNTASGNYSTVPGGYGNSAGGFYSFAAGQLATVRDSAAAGTPYGDQGTFIWSDAQGSRFTSTGQNQFLIRAAGGVGINKNNPTAALDVSGNGLVSGSLGSGTLTVTGNASVSGNLGIGTLAPNRPLHIAEPNSAEMSMQVTNGLTDWKTWNLWVGGGAGLAQNLTFRMLNDAGNGSVRDVLVLKNNGNVTVVSGNNWDLNNSEGDFTIGNGTIRLKVAVPLNGGGAGDVSLKADGGLSHLSLVAAGGTGIYSNTARTAGVTLAAGSGSWASVSDRNMKQDIEEIAPADILAKMAALPVYSWRYKTELSGARHLGPMAQDFYAAFGLGDSDKTITAIDADGVALAAIKGLAAENSRLKAEVDSLKIRMERLEQLLSRK